MAGLSTVAGMLICVIVWIIFGSIPERMDGHGVLLRGGSLEEIDRPATAATSPK